MSSRISETLCNKNEQVERILADARDTSNAAAKLKHVELIATLRRRQFVGALTAANLTRLDIKSVEERISVAEELQLKTYDRQDYLVRYGKEKVDLLDTIVGNESCAIANGEDELAKLNRTLDLDEGKASIAAINHGRHYTANTDCYLILAINDARNDGYQTTAQPGVAQHVAAVVPMLTPEGEPIYSKFVGSMS